MEQGQTDWPGVRWNLTAPESYVLKYVGYGSGIEPFKLAVKELIVRRALRVEPIETSGRFGARKQRYALTEGPVRLAPEPSLAPVLTVFDGVDKRTLQACGGSSAGTRSVEGVVMEDFAKAARKQFRGFYEYRNHVVSGLVARGLMTMEKWMMDMRIAWTDSGREAAGELDRWLQVGRERFGGWVSTDPMKALAYTSDAGAAILLVPDAYPEFALLGQQLLEHRAVAYGSDGGWVGFDTETGASEIDLAGFDLGALGLDSVDFGGLDAVFSAVDFGIDAGGGGGDGGGGDGGGGGF